MGHEESLQKTATLPGHERLLLFTIRQAVLSMYYAELRLGLVGDIVYKVDAPCRAVHQREVGEASKSIHESFPGSALDI